MLGLVGLELFDDMDHSARGLPRQDNSDSEFLALISKHESALAACVHALVPNWQDAEEVLQEPRVTLWRQFADFQPNSDFPAWSRTIARNIARTQLRRNGLARRVLREDVAEALIQEMTQPPLQEDHRQTALAECMQKLGDEARDMLRRFYADGIKIKTIAADLGRSLNGTYMAISRIRRALTECIEMQLRRENRS